MHLRILAAVASFGLLTAFAPAPFLPKNKAAAPPGQLQGLWEVTARNGAVLGKLGKGGFGKGGPTTQTILIEPGKWTFQSQLASGTSRQTPYFLKVYPNARPATFDLRRREDDPLPYGKGIYEVNGDELRVAYRFSGDRPAKFDQDGGARVVLFTLRRVKK